MHLACREHLLLVVTSVDDGSSRAGKRSPCSQGPSDVLPLPTSISVPPARPGQRLCGILLPTPSQESSLPSRAPSKVPPGPRAGGRAELCLLCALSCMHQVLNKRHSILSNEGNACTQQGVPIKYGLRGFCRRDCHPDPDLGSSAPMEAPTASEGGRPQSLLTRDGFCPPLIPLVWNHNCTPFHVWGPPSSVYSEGFFFFFLFHQCVIFHHRNTTQSTFQ